MLLPHDDRLDALLFMVRAFQERQRQEAMRLAFEGPWWIRALQALSFALITCVFYLFFIEIMPLATRGVRIPQEMAFVIAGLTASALLLRGFLADRARRCGGIYDGRFRILE